ncbi:MAG: secretion protein, partial [Flavisolibacter sp.]|nr:secretion protein [Flavisolibacter sp.]
MKKILLSYFVIACTGFSFAQSGLWKSVTKRSDAVTVANKTSIMSPRLFDLDADQLKSQLSQAPKRFSGLRSEVIIAFPNGEGQFENFRINENPNMEPALAARYPNIKSYIGQGIENPSTTIYFSISPLGLQTMTLYPDRSAVFIEPYTTDLSAYAVYRKSDKTASLSSFECKVIATVNDDMGTAMLRPNADDAFLRTFRLAMSVTGEYTAYFGGTKALALAAINNSMTRVNGVFEKDFAARMVLISNNDAVIYTNASTDPYSPGSTGAGGAW